MTNEIEFEQYDCLRIDHENFSLLYFSIEEDDEVEETAWTEEDGFLESGFDATVNGRSVFS